MPVKIQKSPNDLKQYRFVYTSWTLVTISATWTQTYWRNCEGSYEVIDGDVKVLAGCGTKPKDTAEAAIMTLRCGMRARTLDETCGFAGLYIVINDWHVR